MVKGFIEKGIGGLVQIASGGHYFIEENPVFTEKMKQISSEQRSFATQVYDAGTLFIIDDGDHSFVPRFIFRRK